MFALGVGVVVVILACVGYVARHRSEVLTSISCAAIRGLEALKLRRAGLVRRSVRMRPPGYRRSVRAHFLERATTTSPGGNERVLLIIPGFTASAALIMSDLVWKLRPPPSWRVVVMELPLHEANIENFDGAHPGWVAILQYTVAFAKAVGLLGDDDSGPHLHLCGYSLGGRVAMELLHAHPAHVRKLAMIAPAFPETMDDGFERCARTEPRRVHAWRTRAELREVCSFDGMIGCRPGHLLTHSLVQGAMVRDREQTYGRKHGDFFADYVARLLQKEREPSPLDAASLHQVRAPVLLVTGERDRCVDSGKCREQIQDVLGPERCAFHELVDTSHYAAPNADGWLPDGNILYNAAPLCAKFLFGE